MDALDLTRYINRDCLLDPALDDTGQINDSVQYVDDDWSILQGRIRRKRILHLE